MLGDLCSCPPSHTVMALSHPSFHSLLGLPTSHDPVGLTKTGSGCCGVPNCIAGCMGTVDVQVLLVCHVHPGSTPTDPGRHRAQQGRLPPPAYLF